MAYPQRSLGHVRYRDPETGDIFTGEILDDGVSVSSSQSSRTYNVVADWMAEECSGSAGGASAIWAPDSGRAPPPDPRDENNGGGAAFEDDDEEARRPRTPHTVHRTYTHTHTYTHTARRAAHAWTGLGPVGGQG